MNLLAARSAPALAVSTKLLAPKVCQVHHEGIENILFSKESCLKPLAIPIRGMLPVSARRDRKHTVFEGDTYAQPDRSGRQ